MSCVGENADVTVQLPDEVLCHILSFLSLSQKLRSESVNHKFQRCIHKELKMNPQPLEVDFKSLKLNGYTYFWHYNGKFGLAEDIIYAAQSLAKKAKFSSIWIVIHHCERYVNGLMDGILSFLISEHQCLTKLTSFRTDSGCSQALMEKFLGKCDKLSSVRFDFGIIPLNSEPDRPSTFPMDLYQLFKNRRWTELILRPTHYHQLGLIDLLQGIQPNSLRKLDLSSNLYEPELNMVELVNALVPNGSALEELCLGFSMPKERRLPVVDLFESLARLPALSKCDIYWGSTRAKEQFVAAVTSLLVMSDINITVTTYASSFFDYDIPTGCQAVNTIQQIQNVYPGLVVDFDRSGSLILSLGNASMVVKYFVGKCGHCAADDCVQCESFYPSLIKFLHSRASNVLPDPYSVDEEAQHFPNWHLDRCKTEQIVADLHGDRGRHHVSWRALSLEADEDQQLVTINFETCADDEYMEVVQFVCSFSITISYGSCLTNGCTKCGN